MDKGGKKPINCILETDNSSFLEKFSNFQSSNRKKIQIRYCQDGYRNTMKSIMKINISTFPFKKYSFLNFQFFHQPSKKKKFKRAQNLEIENFQRDFSISWNFVQIWDDPSEEIFLYWKKLGNKFEILKRWFAEV